MDTGWLIRLDFRPTFGHHFYQEITLHSPKLTAPRFSAKSDFLSILPGQRHRTVKTICHRFHGAFTVTLSILASWSSLVTGTEGFVIEEARYTEDRELLLRWTDLGPEFCYTVEVSTNRTEGSWTPAPSAEQWPVFTPSWTDTIWMRAPVQFRRVRAFLVGLPPQGVLATLSDEGIVLAWDGYPGFRYNVYWSNREEFPDGQTVKIEDTTSPFSHTGLAYGTTYYYRVTAVAGDQESEVSEVASATIVPLLDPTVSTSMARSSAFLYTGDDPIQTGVAEGTIEPERVAVLRGKVRGHNGKPLSGVIVEVLNHPEFGETETRTDGVFDLAVNGGGQFAIVYRKAGYLPAQRTLEVPWQDYEWAPDVIMLELDPRVSTIDFSEPMGVAQGTPMTDDDGTRQATLLFPQGTTAEMVLPDGTTQPLGSLSVRATEYSVGDNGPAAMPAVLPPTSGYTYCVELSVDEAIAAGASEVQLDRPLPFYVENFLGMPIGIAVPAGYYDRERGSWVPSADGRVIQIVSMTGGVANLDTNGDTLADSPATLAELGITEAEQRRLAELYSADQSLWRVPVTHLTPYDLNYGVLPPADSVGPDNPESTVGTESVTDDPCEEEGWGIIEPAHQILRESFDLVGAPYSLNYASDRVLGYRAGHEVTIPLSGASVPASLRRIVLELTVAGRRFEWIYPAAPNQTAVFLWDGHDAYGRRMQGEQPVKIRIGYVYGGFYAMPFSAPSFLLAGRTRIPGDVPARQEFTFWQEQLAVVRTWDARKLGLGGWTLDIHHAYDPSGKRLYLGNGRRRSVENVNTAIVTPAGHPFFGFSGDGGPAVDARLNSPLGMAFAPDGSYYIADSGNHRIRRVGVDGIITTVAGNGRTAYDGDGGPAVETACRPTFVDLGPDDSIYLAEEQYYRVRRVGLDGTINTVAGDGSETSSGDGGPAVEAGLSVGDIAVDPNGGFYVADIYNSRVRWIGPDGIIHTVAGTGESGFSGDGGPAVEAKLDSPWILDLGPDGTLYISGGNRVRAVTPDGIIRTVAGNGSSTSSGDGGPATQAGMQARGVFAAPDGSLYIADRNYRIRRVGPDGILTTVAGTGESGLGEENEPATGSELRNPFDVAIAPDGNLYIAEQGYNRIRKVYAILPGFDANEIAIPSEDGNRLYQFSPEGRHLATINALTGNTIYTFGYGSSGLLETVTDSHGNVTAIERDGSGRALAIEGPYGKRTLLSVDEDNQLTSVRNPAGEEVHLAYSGEGSLAQVTGSRGSTFEFTYDALGRLLEAQDPADAVLGLETIRWAGGSRATIRSALGRTTVYEFGRTDTGATVRTKTFPSGALSTLRQNDDGSQTTISPDGTSLTLVESSDNRFGLAAPVPETLTVETPGGLASESDTYRWIGLDDESNPLSVQRKTESIAIQYRRYDAEFTRENLQYLFKTPEQRESRVVVGEHGNVVLAQVGGLAPTEFDYDERGLPVSAIARSVDTERGLFFEHDGAGLLSDVTDGLSRRQEFSYSSAERLTCWVRQDDSEVHYDYDARGNITSLTPPARPAHRFTYNAVGLLDGYSPPMVDGEDASIGFEYNLDQQLVRVAHPGGEAVVFEYDGAGRMVRRLSPDGELVMAYEGTRLRMSSASTSAGDTVAFDYDGFLLTGETWAGAVEGSVERIYNNDFAVTSLRVNGGDTIAFEYDRDLLITKAGDLVVVRGGQSGLPVEANLGDLQDTWDYIPFGEPVLHEVTYAGSTWLFSAVYERDVLGRIIEVTETVAGDTQTLAYTYDLFGRLTEVKRDGVLAETYSYDANGNRLSVVLAGEPAVTAAYDEQDRLTQYGSKHFENEATGERSVVTDGGSTTTYEYDALGTLTGVQLADGRRLDYVLDAMGRRIAKRVDGVQIRGFLYRDNLNPVAELDGANQVAAVFVYGIHQYVPDYLINNGVNYRLVTDHLGSVRLVVDTRDGSVVQRLDYDAFGKVRQDSNPGFQPFGFAGGLYDPDTGLTRLGAREYDAETGRWTSRDPTLFAGGSANLYSYSLNDPVNQTDPTGLGPNWNRIAYGGAAMVAGVVQISVNVFKVAAGNWPALGGVKGGAENWGYGLYNVILGLLVPKEDMERVPAHETIMKVVDWVNDPSQHQADPEQIEYRYCHPGAFGRQ